MKRQDFVRKLGRIGGPEVVKAAGRVLYTGSSLIRAEAYQSIERGSVSGKGHKPSLPGEPPNNDTGHLAGNIEAQMTGPLSAEVTSNAGYAADLEFGTSRVAARPYMRPARDSKAETIHRLFAEEIGKIIDRA